jgi:type 1 glutamine amidotransferase
VAGAAGRAPELKARGVAPTGTENFGGTIVTAGGLVFIGGTQDEKFRAFDKSTGKVLWEHQLPAGGYAIPCTYAANGRQYVVIAAGGGGKLGTKSGDAFVAFALPEEPRPVDKKPVKPAKIVFLAGKKSHGPGEHEYEKGLALLKRALETSPNLPPGSVRAELHANGWPSDPATLDDADAIVLFSDGSDHNESDHPLLFGDRLDRLDRAMKRGAGLVALHYTLFVPNNRGGPQFMEWLGGYFDYQSGPGANGWYSKIQTATTTSVPAVPEHPITRGLRPFPLREEFYYNLRFKPGDGRVTPLLTTPLPGEVAPQVVAWAVERADGGRGFAFTGGHFHSNWQSSDLRRMILNAIVWTAKRDVPESVGVRSLLPRSLPQGSASAVDSSPSGS